MIAGIVLAAGGSTRMGRPKMLLPVANGTLLSSVVAPLLAAGLDRVVVVLGDRFEEVGRDAKLPADPRLRLVVNERWAEGMASSLRRGLAACRDADAVLLALGDQPGVTAGLVRRIVDAFESRKTVVVPVHGARAGHPVLFPRSLFPELDALAGDLGAREVLLRHWSDAVPLDAEPLADIDTEEEYRRFVEGRAEADDEGFEVPEA